MKLKGSGRAKETPAQTRGRRLRERGWKGPIDRNGRAVTTDRLGRPLPIFGRRV